MVYSKNLIETIFKKNTNLRISNSSIQYLKEILEKEILEISKNSKKIANHSKRKVVKKEDVNLFLFSKKQ